MGPSLLYGSGVNEERLSVCAHTNTSMDNKTRLLTCKWIHSYYRIEEQVYNQTSGHTNPVVLTAASQRHHGIKR